MVTTAMNLYLFYRKRIEEVASNCCGITTDHLIHLVNNEFFYNNLMEYLQLIESGEKEWPQYWCRPPYEFKYKFPGAYQPRRNFANVLPYDPEDDEDETLATFPITRTVIQELNEEN